MDAQVQVAIVRAKLEEVERSIYSCVIDKRVAAKVGDAEMEKRAVALLTKMEKMKDEYEAVLKELG